MNRRHVIAISQRVDCLPTRGESRDALDQRLTRWASNLGAVVVPVPNMLADNLSHWLDEIQPSALLLSGGNDIGESPERDRTEIALLRHAEHTGLPALGICRGMQMMIKFAGSPLALVTDHVRTRHSLEGDLVVSGSLPAEVNSFHKWGLQSCPEGYEELATAVDGTIEAIHNRTLRWEGWMWHPERETPFGRIELARAQQLLIGE